MMFSLSAQASRILGIHLNESFAAGLTLIKTHITSKFVNTNIVNQNRYHFVTYLGINYHMDTLEYYMFGKVIKKMQNVFHQSLIG